MLSGESALFRSQLSSVLDCINEEIDDHRLAINENTSELAATNEFLNEINSRLDVLCVRVDELALLVKGAKEEKNFVFKSLSSREKEVFQAIYSLTELQPAVSYEQLASNLLFEKSAVVSLVTAMIQKGIPVLKKHDSNLVFLKLDPDFRSLQAKRNIVGLDAPLTAWIG